MAEILNFVDSRGLVHGDINGKNLAWTMSPVPVMYLIDCDGMVPQTPPPTEGVQAMGWADPRVIDHLIPAHDQYSDWYALALAMYRGLLMTPGKLDSRQSDGSWPKPKDILADLHATIATLMHRGLDHPLDPLSRPQPAEWVQGLIETFLENGRFNDDAVEKLDELSAVTAATRPAFTQLPPTNWSRFPPRPSTPSLQQNYVPRKASVPYSRTQVSSTHLRLAGSAAWLLGFSTVDSGGTCAACCAASSWLRRRSCISPLPSINCAALAEMCRRPRSGGPRSTYTEPSP